MKNKRRIFSFIMLIALMLNIFVPRNIVSVKANEISRVSLTDGVIVDIAAGTDHNLALDQQGNLWAWGRNDYGQLGDGTTTNSNVPIQIMRGHKFKKISAGNSCSAAIDVNGYLYGWGNEYNPNNVECLTPTLVSNSILYKDVHCSYDSTQTTKTNENMNYFGYAYYYYYYHYSSAGGTYGYTNNYYTKQCHDDYHPKMLSNKTYRSFVDYRSYSSYSTKDHTIANDIVSADGNYFMYYSESTYAYSALYQYEFIVDSVGRINTRFFGGKGYSNNSNGINTPHVFFSNLDLSSLDDDFITMTSVRKTMTSSTTGNSTVFFINDEGKMYSVGYNGSDNFLGNSDYKGTEIMTSPVEVKSSATFVKVSAGQSHVIALDDNGKIYTWGNNTYGQLGHGDFFQRDNPTKISLLDETKSFNFNAFSNEVFSNTFCQYGGSNYSVIEDGSKGTFDIDKDSGEFTYTPNENEYGEDTALISISYSGVIIDYQVNVYIDRKPVFMGGTPSFNVECGQSYTGVAPATDPDNHNLSYSIVKQPLKGEVVLNNNSGSFTYTAGNDLAGNDSFTIGVSDGYCIVEYPVIVHIQSMISYDDETTINIDLLKNNSYSGNVSAKDIDGDTLSYSISKLPVKGNVSIDDEGNYIYNADGDKYGEDAFTIKIDDGYKPLEVKYTVNLYAVNDAGTTLVKKITQGTTYSDTVKTNAYGAIPTYLINKQPANGNVVIDSETGEYTYTPNEGSIGDDSFEVLVDYSYGQYILTIHIYQNSIPNGDEILLDITTQENVNYTGTVVCEDIDGDILSYSLKTKPLKGSALVNPNTGEYTYYPNKDVAGNDSFEIEVDDGTDKITIVINVHIESLIEVEETINKVITQNTSLSDKINAKDKDGDSLVFSIKKDAENGISNIDSNTGEYIYIPLSNFYGSDSFIIEVNDGVVSKHITINIFVNRRPTTDQVTINLTTNGITVTGKALCDDPDGDTLTYSVESMPKQGSVIINSSSGTFAYTPNADAAGDDTFTIKATDGCDDVIVLVIVHNETELEIDLTNTNIAVNQGKSTTGQVNATDLDDDTLTYSIESHPKQGTINLNVNTGAWTYTATKNASGTDTFTVSVTDGNTIKYITYNLSINTPAEFGDSIENNIVVNENSNYNGKVNASDKDGDSLSYSIVSQGTKGTVTIDPTSGRYVYIPNEGAAGDDTFIIGVSDGNFVTEIEIKVHIETDLTVDNSIITTEVEKDGVATGKINAEDKDGDVLTFSVDQQGEKGTVIITNDGSWTYFANEGAGDDTFVIAVSDGEHTKYIVVYIHISTSPIFEESNITINVSESGSTSGQVTGVDEDGDDLSYEVTSQPTNGTVTLNSQTGEYTYTAFSNSNATEDIFVITVTDGENETSVTIRVIINNSPDVIDSELTVNQDGNGSGKIEVTDPENDDISFSVGTQGNKGTVTINSKTGEYTYVTTDKNYSGIDTFTIIVSDGYNTQEVVVTVTIVKNYKPSSDGNQINVESNSTVTGKIEATDNEGDELTFSITHQGDKGTAVINEKTGEYTYTSYKDTEGYDCFVVTISDEYNSVSYLIEVNITFVDSNNSWAIPTTIATSSAAILSLTGLAFVLIKRKKRKII